MKQITFKQYKAIDIAIMSALLFIFEALGIYLSKNWFSTQALVVSLTPLVVAIVMMRWSEFAFVPAIIGGISYCIGGGGKIEHYLIYSLGNLLGLLSVLIFRKFGKEKIRAKMINLVAFAGATYVFMVIGRWLVSLIFEPSIQSLLRFLTTDIISLVVAAVGLIALQKSDGMLEDQKSYLIRIDRERKEEQKRREEMPYPGIYGENDPDEDEDYDEDDYGDEGIIYDDPPEEYESSIGYENEGEEISPENEIQNEEIPLENENNEENISEDKI